MPIDKLQTIEKDTWYIFRAWDEINNVMHYDFEWMTVKKGDDILGIIYQSDIYEHKFEEWPPKLDFEQRMIRMNYIRVKDSIEKKIYQLDFVKVNEPDKEYIGIVLFNDGGCPFAFDVENKLDGGEYNRAYFDNPNNKFEIVGNYYENPEMRGAGKYFAKNG